MVLTVLVSLQLSALGQRVHPKHGAEVPYAPHQQLCKEGRERKEGRWGRNWEGRGGGGRREGTNGGKEGMGGREGKEGKERKEDGEEKRKGGKDRSEGKVRMQE